MPHKDGGSGFGALLAMILAWAFLSSPPAWTSSQIPQACAEVGSGPVIRDTGPTYMTVGSGNGTVRALYYTTTHDGPSVMIRNGQFLMWLRVDTNATNGIYRAVSSDGVDWTISASPALSPGPVKSWDNAQVLYPDVVWNGTGYMMYYMGDGGNTSSFRQIGVAFSSDGLTWTKYSQNPVITHGPGTYDAQYTRAPSVIFDNGTYKMWYTGTPALADVSKLGYFYSIDYAVSHDGVHWTKSPANPVFLGEQESGMTSAGWPSVVKVNGTYLMAFSDGDNMMGYATSGDGIAWAFSNSSNVLLGPQSWHNASLLEPSLLLQGSRLLLWYNGIQGGTNASAPYYQGIGFATCGLALLPSSTVTTTTASTTVTVTRSTVSTSISTSIVSSTLTSTLVQNPNSSIDEFAAAGFAGAAAAFALSVAVSRLRLRKRS